MDLPLTAFMELYKDSIFMTVDCLCLFELPGKVERCRHGPLQVCFNFLFACSGLWATVCSFLIHIYRSYGAVVNGV